MGMTYVLHKRGLYKPRHYGVASDVVLSPFTSQILRNLIDRTWNKEKKGMISDLDITSNPSKIYR